MGSSTSRSTKRSSDTQTEHIVKSQSGTTSKHGAHPKHMRDQRIRSPHHPAGFVLLAELREHHRGTSYPHNSSGVVSADTVETAETTEVLSGAPNSGKSSLVVNLATSLELTRTKTTSKIFWLYARNSRPYFSLWLFCTDFFWDEQEPSWSKMAQSINSVSKLEEFGTGAIFIEGHRIFEYEQYAELGTSLFYLASSDQLTSQRGTSGESVKKHTLDSAKHLDALQEMKGLTLLDAQKTKVSLVCKILQICRR